mmetsp:Transcript_26094/g.75331  ORF Transcript_26094/g.75331 Transcript_26094/m.75331 type:complete len:203 (+) Transcript_26094:4167-4775(+)
MPQRSSHPTFSRAGHPAVDRRLRLSRPQGSRASELPTSVRIQPLFLEMARHLTMTRAKPQHLCRVHPLTYNIGGQVDLPSNRFMRMRTVPLPSRAHNSRELPSSVQPVLPPAKRRPIWTLLCLRPRPCLAVRHARAALGMCHCKLSKPSRFLHDPRRVVRRACTRWGRHQASMPACPHRWFSRALLVAVWHGKVPGKDAQST